MTKCEQVASYCHLSRKLADNLARRIERDLLLADPLARRRKRAPASECEHNYACQGERADDNVRDRERDHRLKRLSIKTGTQPRRVVEQHLLLPLHVARYAAAKVRPGGTLLLISGTGGRRPAIGMAVISALTAALPALTKVLAIEIAPVRVNLIAPGFVDTPLSATLLGDQLDQRRDQLRTKLPIGRVVGPADVAALAVHVMTNTAVTGATYDIDGGQQIVEA